MTADQQVEIKPGQIWRSRDRRESGRLCRVVHVMDEKAVMVPCDPIWRDIGIRRTRVNVRRMAAGAWELVR